jgi:hypothetical protein
MIRLPQKRVKMYHYDSFFTDMIPKVDHYVICRTGYYFLKKYLDNLTPYAILEVKGGWKWKKKE